jgi:hypothetical protein
MKPPRIIPPNAGQWPEAEKENLPIWTGTKYETYGTIKRRGWRYSPGDQCLPD